MTAHEALGQADEALRRYLVGMREHWPASEVAHWRRKARMGYVQACRLAREEDETDSESRKVVNKKKNV